MLPLPYLRHQLLLPFLVNVKIIVHGGRCGAILAFAAPNYIQLRQVRDLDYSEGRKRISLALQDPIKHLRFAKEKPNTCKDERSMESPLEEHVQTK